MFKILLFLAGVIVGSLSSVVVVRKKRTVTNDTLDFPMWVNDACDDIETKFNNLVARYNHPTYRNQ